MIKESSKIEIHKEFFTDTTAKKYTNKIDLFISDIRTMDSTAENKQSSKWTSLIDNDQQLQFNWVKIIKPKFYSLKFRLNYNLKK